MAQSLGKESDTGKSDSGAASESGSAIDKDEDTEKATADNALIPAAVAAGGTLIATTVKRKSCEDVNFHCTVL